MNLIWLEDFAALAATGNFSRAAEDRHSSQPAFSRRIRALEEWVGFNLFDRSSHPVKLTETGEWFVLVAQELNQRVARVPGDAKKVAEAASITLRIASTHVLSFTFLPSWLRSLESHTTVGPVQLMSDVLQRCEALMRDSKVQFVLSHAHPRAQGTLDAEPYLSVPVSEDVLVAVSKPDESGRAIHRLSDGSGPTIPVLQYTEESGLGRIVRAVLGRRLESVPIQIVFSAHLASALRTMVLDGRGIAWLPWSLIEDDVAQKRLVGAASADWNIPLEVRLYRESELRGKAANAFWQAAVKPAPSPGAR